MAEETLKYKIEIDDTDIAQKLQDLRNRIDAAIGSSFNQNGFIGSTPGTSPFESPVLLPPTPNFSSQVPGGIFNNFISNAGMGSNMLAQDIGNLTNNSRMAFDATNTGGTINPVLGMFGFGYDGRSTTFLSDYQTAASDRFATSIGDVGQWVGENSLSLGVGALAGAAFGGPAGLIAGFAADAVIDYGLTRYKASENFSEGLQEISRGTLGYANSTRSDQLTADIYKFTKTTEGHAGDLDLPQAGNILLNFADAGGFSNVSSSAELETKAQSIIENISRVAKTLGMFQDEAARILGELDAKGISPVENSASFAAGLRGTALNAGTTVGDLMAAGMSTASMLNSMDFSPATAFSIGVDARAEMERMANGSNPVISRSIAQMGGAVSAANQMVQNNIALGMGPMGTFVTSSMNGGAVLGSNPTDMLIGASNFYGETPSNYFSQRYNQQGQWGEIMSGPDANAKMSTLIFDYAYNMLNMQGQVGASGKISDDVIMGYVGELAPKFGLGQVSPATLRTMLQSVRDYGSRAGGAGNYAMGEEIYGLIRPDGVSIGDQFAAEWDRFTEKAYKPFGGMGRVAGELGDLFKTAGISAANWVSDAWTGTTRISADDYKNLGSADIIDQALNWDTSAAGKRAREISKLEAGNLTQVEKDRIKIQENSNALNSAAVGGNIGSDDYLKTYAVGMSHKNELAGLKDLKDPDALMNGILQVINKDTLSPVYKIDSYSKLTSSELKAVINLSHLVAPDIVTKSGFSTKHQMGHQDMSLENMLNHKMDILAEATNVFTSVQEEYKSQIDSSFFTGLETKLTDSLNGKFNFDLKEEIADQKRRVENASAETVDMEQAKLNALGGVLLGFDRPGLHGTGTVGSDVTTANVAGLRASAKNKLSGTLAPLQKLLGDEGAALVEDAQVTNMLRTVFKSGKDFTISEDFGSVLGVAQRNSLNDILTKMSSGDVNAGEVQSLTSGFSLMKSAALLGDNVQAKKDYMRFAGIDSKAAEEQTALLLTDDQSKRNIGLMQMDIHKIVTDGISVNGQLDGNGRFKSLDKK